MNARPHYLVTGGAGFIGSHLTERLLADGASVTVIDDCSTGRPENLGRVADDPRLTFLRSKVSNTPHLNQLVRSATGVFHLAAAVGVDLVVSSPIRTIRTNLDETEAILEAASGSSTPILITSTSEVYGKSQKPAFSEEDDLLIGPPHLGRWSYACSKLMDEFLALAYTRERKVPVLIARLFNTVGPRQTGQYGMVLPRFVAAAQSGKPLKVFGDGHQTRCFCYVGDTVEALVRLMRDSKVVGEVFNVGSDHEVSIKNLALKVIQILNSASALELVPYEHAYGPGFEDMLRRKPVVDKLARFTSFRPTTSLETIIRRTAELPDAI